jgi:flagellar assembly factor FliW
MMKVETYLFGNVDVSPEKVINFPLGLVGFERSKCYMLVHEATSGPVSSFTLQSLDDAMLAFQIIDPASLGFSYQLELSDAENDLLGVPIPEDVLVMQVVSQSEEAGKKSITPNLRAPLLINTKARIGMQKIMERCVPNLTLSNLANPL